MKIPFEGNWAVPSKVEEQLGTALAYTAALVLCAAPLPLLLSIQNCDCHCPGASVWLPQDLGSS